ncbi:NAD(P)H-quinone oxidoreductase subunit F [Leptolyngbya sp. FACHB-261]|uniref:NAD(P)H-quinone oxidoreductase subunit F n=1 Tax=Leptolyngbya sp. FACHB-261 TaxID=2692806 RepID=UPI00168A16A7|nr:NAD(P)H-quinone oxidoreductase subunit F [Leptolyngbya sp. FACHB-261]MBD2100463.1 NAD(P)H-quinone oxidoreductase subunit F [Leptolyngbya sp. FACHB-261]
MAQFFLQTVWLIPSYALIGAVLALPWSPAVIRRTGPRPSGYVNLFMTSLALLHGLLALSALWGQPPHTLSFSWLEVAGLHLTFDLKISALTVGATVLIAGLNLLAQLFAVGYLEMDWGWARFYSLMALFEAGMCALVLCDSLFFSYIFLEILTLGTYLLVGYWFSQPLVVTGARDAFLTKRVGDLVLLMGVLALLPLAGTWNFSELAVWAQTANLEPRTATLLGLALIAGPMGKCAQFPLQLWLDEAMEGPVPSSILRNSVVVATGAWVLVKLEPVLALSPVVMATLVFIGALTAVGAALIAIAQVDVKRALSYSVSSFMGLVFVAVGTGQTEVALLLVFTHAIAQALLFMSIGAVVWNSITQDLRQYGGLWSRRPISGIGFVVGAATLVGLLPLGSFWPMVELLNHFWTTEPWLAALVLLVNGLTAFSLTRVFGLIFGGPTKVMSSRSPEVAWPMMLPLTLMTGFALHVPLVLAQWQLLPAWSTLDWSLTTALAVTGALGCGLAGVLYLPGRPESIQFGSKSFQEFFAYDFYIQRIYRVSVVGLVDVLSRFVSWVDHYLVDGVVNFTGLATIFSGQVLRYSVSGLSQVYILAILLGMLLVGLLVMQ